MFLCYATCPTSNVLPVRVRCCFIIPAADSTLLYVLSHTVCCTLLWQISGLSHCVVPPTLCCEAWACWAEQVTGCYGYTICCTLHAQACNVNYPQRTTRTWNGMNEVGHILSSRRCLCPQISSTMYQEKCFGRDMCLDNLLPLVSSWFSRLKQPCLRTTTEQVLKTSILRL